ncbi:MAG: rod-binding protein [Sandaracinobacter sp.]|jgi:Rod binding domain-containing protein
MMTMLPDVPPLGATTPIPRPAGGKMAAKATEFEGVFLGQLAKTMLETVELGDSSGGFGEEMFRGVLAENIGTEMARGGGIGLAPAILQHLIKAQGGQE